MKPEPATENPPAKADVYPLAGNEHDMADDCWCVPYRDDDDRAVRVHRLVN